MNAKLGKIAKWYLIMDSHSLLNGYVIAIVREGNSVSGSRRAMYCRCFRWLFKWDEKWYGKYCEQWAFYGKQAFEYESGNKYSVWVWWLTNSAWCIVAIAKGNFVSREKWYRSSHKSLCTGWSYNKSANQPSAIFGTFTHNCCWELSGNTDLLTILVQLMSILNYKAIRNRFFFSNRKRHSLFSQ